MAKKVIQKYFVEGDMPPMVKLFVQRKKQMRVDVYMIVTDSGMELASRQETGVMGLEYGQHPLQTLHRKTQFVNAESVRKLFGAQNYSEMLLCIKARFHDETAYDDLIDYFQENNIV